MKIPLLDLQAQLKTIEPQASQAIQAALERAQYILGPNVKALEQEIADYMGVKHAIGVANGTDALVIALKSLGIGQADEVIVPAFTYFATAEAVAFVGATPVFVDVDRATYNIDVDQIEARITAKTKAILPVHLFGQACRIDQVMAIARKHQLHVVEDCAQSIGATFDDKMTGTFGDFGTLSFFPTKNLGCAGDGGMIVTNDDRLATIALALRAHGSGLIGEKAYNHLHGIVAASEEESDKQDNTVYNAAKYYNYLIGHNSRLDEIQAALLRVKLPRLDQWNEGRRANADHYDQAFGQTKLVTPHVIDKAKAIYHQYVIQSEDRAGLIAHLEERGVATGVYYPIPLHLQKAFSALGYQPGDLPVSEYLAERTLALPIYPELTQAQLDHIIQSVLAYE